MKILFAGGGTGGHFYPIIAIAEKINEIIDKEKIVKSKLYFMSDTPYDSVALFDHGIEFKKVETGKIRMYFSIQNFFDIIKTFFAVFKALFKVYRIYPDVVVGKGGYASFPALMAARILRIPVVIHESDSYPGRVNKWAGKFAERIAVSFDEAAQYFPSDRTAHTGQPIRSELLQPSSEGMFEYLKLDPTVPVILILGGSQGAEVINNVILSALPELLSKYQIIHQTGKKHLKNLNVRAEMILTDSPYKDRYKTFDFLGILATKMAAGASDIIVSRAGSQLFEIAIWGVPSIIIPITHSHGDHQARNAFNYARSGAAIAIEESNLQSHILLQELDKLMKDDKKREEMKQAAKKFATPDAAEKIAQEIVNIALRHESR
ncbi:undecaprenyldiphospho-muramoylpentapeptide beta-N-acetylglucosaminyltransferase [Candidatus Wolfebacteria bacterium]|nr:MAG: undecaprenyldiphospho-muramoylpentapeptide beta-N-acetylglucosaminyltransferase [Candidatus Wolfebacteria bacterium]